MANPLIRLAEGERYTPKYPSEYPASQSDLRPLPFYPNLKAVFRSVTASLVFTYLEIHCPTPQDSSGTFLRVPVTLHLDMISEDLQISRRTLFTALCVLAARWRNDEMRLRAARAGREFLNPYHTVNGQTKPYSITGAIGYVPHTEVQLHRNIQTIAFMLRKAGISTLVQEDIRGIDQFEKSAEEIITASTLPIRSKREAIRDTLLDNSALSEDRRKTRYSRLRAAVQAGLEPPSKLRVIRHSENDMKIS